MIKRGWEKTIPQIEKTDDLQSIANHPFFCVYVTSDCYDLKNADKISRKSTAFVRYFI